jgi:hypothetical protein
MQAWFSQSKIFETTKHLNIQQCILANERYVIAVSEVLNVYHTKSSLLKKGGLTENIAQAVIEYTYKTTEKLVMIFSYER